MAAAEARSVVASSALRSCWYRSTNCSDAVVAMLSDEVGSSAVNPLMKSSSCKRRVAPARRVERGQVPDRRLRSISCASVGLHSGDARAQVLQQQREAQSVVADRGMPALRGADVEGGEEVLVEAHLVPVSHGDAAAGLVVAARDLCDQHRWAAPWHRG